jgi:hypothetical protein
MSPRPSTTKRIRSDLSMQTFDKTKLTWAPILQALRTGDPMASEYVLNALAMGYMPTEETEAFQYTLLNAAIEGRFLALVRALLLSGVSVSLANIDLVMRDPDMEALIVGLSGGFVSFVEALDGGYKGLKLVSVTRSHNPDKKYDATFKYPDGHTKTVSFGATGYEDYTMHHDKERRRRYIERHSRREPFTDPTKPGTLSRYILWGDATNVKSGISGYKRRFGL